MERDLEMEFDQWLPGDEPTERFMYLLGRISGEAKWKMEGSYLTAARIRNRTYGYVKTDDGCLLKNERHPGAFQNGFVSQTVEQTWKADIHNRTLLLLSTETR